MHKEFSKFVCIQEGFLKATEGDVACSVILDTIESLSILTTGKSDSWVEVSAKSMEERTFGVVARRTVSKKVKYLKDKGLVEVRFCGDNWPSYKLNQEAINAAIRNEDERSKPSEDD